MTRIYFPLNDLSHSLKARKKKKKTGQFSKTWLYPFKLFNTLKVQFFGFLNVFFSE